MKLCQNISTWNTKRFRNFSKKIHEGNRRPTEIMGRNGVKVIPISLEIEEEKFRTAEKQALKSLQGRLFSKKTLNRVLAFIE